MISSSLHTHIGVEVFQQSTGSHWSICRVAFFLGLLVHVCAHLGCCSNVFYHFSFFFFFCQKKKTLPPFSLRWAKKFLIENIKDPDEEYIELEYRWCWKVFTTVCLPKHTRLGFFMHGASFFQSSVTCWVIDFTGVFVEQDCPIPVQLYTYLQFDLLQR
jgi:hypothetical protein